jgi:hypothetical protein
MTVQTPPFLGVFVRKNDRTRGFIERQIEILRKVSPDARVHLDADEHLIALSVAMNGHDLESTIEELEQQDAVYGVDFVATQSADGVLGGIPSWLHEESVRLGPYKQLTKFYSLVSTGGSVQAVPNKTMEPTR